MMEENISRASSVGLTAFTDSSATKKRKKRKWDQPAELFVSAGVAVPGILPPCNSVTIPGASSSSGAVQENAIGIQSNSKSPPFQVPSVHPLATATGPKINQPKIQDEVIAREIVINDADSAIRYKLTKRQTQEEIQKCSGAVVITRGKYHPSNAVPDSEKPLYLHISAGAHLETTVERIKAVDLAAAMVEEMLKQASVTNGGMVVHPGSTCVYLGFEVDPSLNIAARIRGPNDQYVNHIMKETGATVILRGHGSGNAESSHDEERQLPLHLFLSSNNLKSLESAKLLAENLLDTIGREVGASRISACNIYGGGNEVALNNNLSTTMVTSAVNSVATLPVSSAIHTGVTTALHQGTLIQSTGVGCYPQMTITSGTSYHGYGGIYPQATPLQQVALALRQSPSLINATPAPATTATSTAANSSETSSSDKEKRRRKFQELPFASNWCAETDKGRLLKPVDQEPDLRHRNLLTFPAPKELAHSSINVTPRPPPKIMPPPPPPQKFNSPAPALKVTKSNALEKPKQDTIPDTLVKLMEYGEEDEEDDETTEEPNIGYLNGLAAPKPFWAV